MGGGALGPEDAPGCWPPLPGRGRQPLPGASDRQRTPGSSSEPSGSDRHRALGCWGLEEARWSAVRGLQTWGFLNCVSKPRDLRTAPPCHFGNEAKFVNCGKESSYLQMKKFFWFTASLSVGVGGRGFCVNYIEEDGFRNKSKTCRLEMQVCFWWNLVYLLSCLRYPCPPGINFSRHLT